jgi:serine/threonine protein kinase
MTLPEHPQGETLPASGPPAWTNLPGAPIPPRIGDFEVVSKLGEGSFGQVFLARQMSLGRHVALKVIRGQHATDRGEGQLLAGLEHDHIVKVFSAFADSDTGLHGLCLQYVPGADLGLVIRHIHSDGQSPKSGQAVVAALDTLRKGDPGFDPAALRDREMLATDNFAQAVCRVGGKLAEALAFAHARGILHCDIKPGNILLTPYGRPMLADFNVAFDRTRHTPGDTRYGGTLAYMAPEYHAVMLGQPGGSADERCDIYSLGVVLYELATGKRPLPTVVTETAETVLPDATGNASSSAVFTSDTIEGNPLAQVPRELAAVIRRCLDRDPTRRYQTATELATALSGAWHLLAARRALPAPSRIGRWVTAHPAWAIVLAGVLPHFIASVAQIEYNAVEIKLDDEQHRVFTLLVVVYNLIAYGVCGGLGVYLVWRLARGLSQLNELPGEQVDRLRRRAKRLAWQLAALGALGWLPGAIVFPLVIDLATGLMPGKIYGHFAVSFTLAGLIGVVFSYLGIQYAVFRALLPQLGNPDTHTPTKMWAEVRPLTAPFGLLVLLACGVPLLGAVLLLTLDDGPMTFGFRLLVVKLIGLGVAGVSMAERVVRRLRQLAAVWQVEAGEGRS